MNGVSSFFRQLAGALVPIIAFLIMLLWQTKFVGMPSNYMSPLIWLLAGLGISIYFLNHKEPKFLESRSNKSVIYLTPIFLSIVFLACGYDLSVLFNKYPATIEYSDVIPSLELYVKRLLSGEKVYEILEFPFHKVHPTYYPAMWLPYTIPELLGIDYRWMAYGSFVMIYMITVFYEIGSSRSYQQLLLSGILPLLALKWIMHYDEASFAHGVELMPLSYYLLLIFGLRQKNFWLIIIALTLCTLSRYSYTLWILPFAWVIVKEHKTKYLLKMAFVGLSLIVLMYVLPFLIWDPQVFIDGLKYYKGTVEGQWKVQSWQANTDIPYHLNRGRSFSIWFYSYIEGDFSMKLWWASTIHFVAMLLGSSTLIILTRIVRGVEWNNFLIIGLLFYLVLFYSFITVPFSYLFILPLFVAMVIVVIYFKPIKWKYLE